MHIDEVSQQWMEEMKKDQNAEMSDVQVMPLQTTYEQIFDLHKMPFYVKSERYSDVISIPSLIILK